MTGAGFGGCAIALVDNKKVDEFKDTAYNKDYREKKYKEGIENEYF